MPINICNKKRTTCKLKTYFLVLYDFRQIVTINKISALNRTEGRFLNIDHE